MEDLDLEVVEVEVGVEPEVFDYLCMVVVSHNRSLCAGEFAFGEILFLLAIYWRPQLGFTLFPNSPCLDS